MFSTKLEILKYLQEHKTITNTECREVIGTTELRARIAELRKTYNIDDVWEYGKNRYGNDTKWKKYIYLGKKIK